MMLFYIVVVTAVEVEKKNIITVNKSFLVTRQKQTNIELKIIFGWDRENLRMNEKLNKKIRVWSDTWALWTTPGLGARILCRKGVDV